VFLADLFKFNDNERNKVTMVTDHSDSCVVLSQLLLELSASHGLIEAIPCSIQQITIPVV
jgi:hypothetical protein